MYIEKHVYLETHCASMSRSSLMDFFRLDHESYLLLVNMVKRHACYCSFGCSNNNNGVIKIKSLYFFVMTLLKHMTNFFLAFCLLEGNVTAFSSVVHL